MDLFKKSDEEKIKEAYDIIRSVNDFVLKCFTVGWNWIPARVGMGDRMMVEKMIADNDNESVRSAFLEARAQGKENLAYVRSVAQSIYQKKRSEEHQKEGEKIKADFNKKDFFEKSEDTQTWKGMFDEILKDVKLPEVNKDESYKETEEYKYKKILFDQESKCEN